MQGDAAYTVFFAFGIIWIAMGVAAFIGLLKLDKQQSGNQQQQTQFDGSGILVALPIILGIVVALAIAAKIS
ncbi:MAG: hypothetical protein KME43_20700 [Myxacorys chilensis ATA2-1-KO14]|jgi:hypothetical protein|nr:hypothetical protein [Myxacorys chilensis ATA2-1-KO14]